jgi:contractile injection system tape measure protein
VPSLAPHIIRRQVWQLEVFGTEADGFALQRSMPDLCHGLAPALEPVLDRTVSAGEHMTIDRLEIDAGTLSLEHLERDLIGAVTEALEKRLREYGLTVGSTVSSSPIQRRTEAQTVQEAFLHFLKTGSLPWWFHLPADKTLEDIVQASWQARITAELPEHFSRGVIEALGFAFVGKRLVQQFSPAFLEILLASLSEEAAVALSDVLAKLRAREFAAPSLRRVSDRLWQAAFALVAAGRRPTASALVIEFWSALPEAERQDLALLDWMIAHWPEALDNDTDKKALPDGESEGRERTPPGGDTRKKTRPFTDRTKARTDGAKREQAIARVDLGEGVYVGCAGVVLLHPFLPRLFEGLGIVADDKMVQPERALGLLHFLATGQRVAPEYELLLPKLLCGMPLEEPVPSTVLTAAERDEAVALLAAVIRHWDALGDTSIEGLRGTFLARPGKLFRRDSGDDVLQVEGRSFDILLDRLPWGIGTIQLPWMRRILWVEWTW